MTFLCRRYNRFVPRHTFEFMKRGSEREKKTRTNIVSMEICSLLLGYVSLIRSKSDISLNVSATVRFHYAKWNIKCYAVEHTSTHQNDTHIPQWNCNASIWLMIFATHHLDKKSTAHKNWNIMDRLSKSHLSLLFYCIMWHSFSFSPSLHKMKYVAKLALHSSWFVLRYDRSRKRICCNCTDFFVHLHLFASFILC